MCFVAAGLSGRESHSPRRRPVPDAILAEGMLAFVVDGWHGGATGNSEAAGPGATSTLGSRRANSARRASTTASAIQTQIRYSEEAIMTPIFLVYTFQDAEHLAELVDAVAPYRVFVHVDAKVDLTPFADVANDRTNVEILSERVQVNWGGYSQVCAIRLLVAAALEVSAEHDYLVMLSGSDFPLRAIDEFVDHLGRNQGQQHLRAFEIAGSSAKYTSQVDRRHHRDLRLLSTKTHVKLLRKARNAVIRIIDGPLSLRRVPVQPEGLRIGHGGTHFAVTAECMRAMERLVTPEVERYFRAVFCPEEKFYQSLVMSTDFAESTPARGFERYVGPGNWRYANFHLIDPSLTRVFTIEDWPEVSVSEQFFIRKIVSGPSTSLREKLKSDRLGS